MAAAPTGTRNSTLNTAAYALGQLVGAGLLERADVERRLLAAALPAGLEEREARATIKSGLDAGQEQPRAVSGDGHRTVVVRAPAPTAAALPGREAEHGFQSLPRTSACPRTWAAMPATGWPTISPSAAPGARLLHRHKSHVSHELAGLLQAGKVVKGRKAGTVAPYSLVEPDAAPGGAEDS